MDTDTDTPHPRLSPEQVSAEVSGPLRQYLRRYAGEPSVAEDLLQESLIRITRGLPGFAGQASLKTWAFSIATRVAMDHFRDPAHRVEVVDFDASPDIADPEPAADRRLVADEMNACMRQVIDSLPEDYRAALVLHDLEGLTAAETAEACGCSVATAKIRIHRARERLRDALSRACDFYRDGDDVFRCDRKA
jgi:RNA polymerase sigma-70 factor (ECF subfamily)